MVPHDVEQVRRGHLGQGSVEKAATEGGAGCRERGLEQAQVPETVRPAVSVYLVCVQSQDLVRTGEMTMTSPSVETSRGVPASTPVRLRRGLSSTKARLLPVFVSFFLMAFVPECQTVRTLRATSVRARRPC
jgi:hypothetical protein